MNHTLLLKGGSLLINNLHISNGSDKPVVVTEIGTVLTIHHDTNYVEAPAQRPRNFGWALKHIKDGGYVRRLGWSSKTRWWKVGVHEIAELETDDVMADDWVEA